MQEKNRKKSMSGGRQNRLPSVEETKGSDADALKKVGRFAVSPPLVPELTVRRSSRVRRGSLESSAVISKLLLEVFG